MAKNMISNNELTGFFKTTGRFKGKKVTSHGSYRAKRKPNSPRVKN